MYKHILVSTVGKECRREEGGGRREEGGGRREEGGERREERGERRKVVCITQRTSSRPQMENSMVQTAPYEVGERGQAVKREAGGQVKYKGETGGQVRRRQGGRQNNT